VYLNLVLQSANRLLLLSTLLYKQSHILRIPPADDVRLVSMHLDCWFDIRKRCVGNFDVPYSNLRGRERLCN